MDNNLVLKELAQLIYSDKISGKIQSIDQNTYKFAGDDNNHNQVFQACLEVLKRDDPKNASFENVELLVKKMQNIAQEMVLKG